MACYLPEEYLKRLIAPQGKTKLKGLNSGHSEGTCFRIRSGHAGSNALTRPTCTGKCS